MPGEQVLSELAALVSELREELRSLRLTAARLSSEEALRRDEQPSARDLARRAKPELERAERRGIGGRNVP